MEEKNIVALEIGSSKIKGAVGKVDASGALCVKAVEEVRLTDCVRHGCIRNVAETAEAVRSVVASLEQRDPSRRITGVYVALGGRSLMSQTVDIERRLASEMEITADLIADMTSEALAYPLHERTVVGATPREIKVDNSPTARPVGIVGQHVAARLNLVSVRNQLVRNLDHVLAERVRLKVADRFVRQLSEADLVLYPEEKRKGCMLVDFGAETTTVSIYRNGALLYLATIPLGSRNITRDITVLNYLEEKAEDLKISLGNALLQPDTPVAATEAAQVNNYVAARAGEIIANINEQIKYAGLTPDRLPAGIILVGRGSRLSGFDQRLASLTTLPVRFGTISSRVRLADSRIQGSDHIDVISILASAAAYNPEECMEPLRREPVAAPQPVQQPAQHIPATPAQQPAAAPSVQRAPAAAPAPKPQPAATAATTTPAAPAQPEDVKRPGGGSRMLAWLSERVARLMTEPVEDDEADNE